MSNKDLMNAYTEMVTHRIKEGFEPHFLTLLFNPIAGTELSRITTMMKETTRLYAKLLKAAFRHPGRMQTADMPLWIFAPDWPVPKRFKDHLANIVLNDGAHMHGIVLQPPTARMERGLSYFIDDNQHIVHGPQHAFQRVRSQEIEETPEKVCSYALKSLARRRIESTDILILPQSHSELSKLNKYERLELKRDADKRRVARIFATRQAR